MLETFNLIIFMGCLYFWVLLLYLMSFIIYLWPFSSWLLAEISLLYNDNDVGRILYKALSFSELPLDLEYEIEKGKYYL